MAGQHVGYIRVSTLDQNTIRQLDGEKLDRVFTDKASGKDQNRPELEALIGFVRDGDTVLVHSMDRLALNFVTPHTFRRSVATWLKAADATAAATAQLGHSSEAVTEEFYIQQQTRGTVDNSVLLQSILEHPNQG